jgi:hypothetical protein
MVRCCQVGKGRRELVVIEEANRTALEEEVPGFILFTDQVVHPTAALILNKRKSR